MLKPFFSLVHIYQYFIT